MITSTRVEDVFLAALEKGTPEVRAAYLRDACRDAPELCRRVERLLEAHPKAQGFLEHPAPLADVTSDLPIREGPGTQIGPYKLLEQIGEGGMGVVFMAEQTKPVQRRVALKIIKAGMDTREVVARFEAERQALAMMDHPNIARVLDVGATDTGRPYFVMELVRGVPMTEFCNEKNLSIRERLELFVTVCQAIQHAHQKGIIHRDLKPANVLVTQQDGRPLAKVIDFGVAKATGQKLTDKTLFTGFAQLIGTPLYMSPEQAEIGAQNVDTRSDIYSLGVLLYELLTGSTPFDKVRLKTAAFDEMRRIIREEEPPRPSIRLSTLAQHAISTVSTDRRSEPRHLRRLFRGELDWIVMKCLEKDRARRYDTASGLASDINHYLCSEPVQACPPSPGYRFRKFARRNRALLTMAGLLAGILPAATAVSTLQAVRARDAQHRAEGAERQAVTDGAIATAVSNFLQHDLFARVSPQTQLDDGFTVNPKLTVREVLDRAASTIGERFGEQPLVEAAIRMSIGTGYYSVGELGTAAAHLERAVALRKTRLGLAHRDTLLAMFTLAAVYTDAGKLRESLFLHGELLEPFQATFGRDSLSTGNFLRHYAKTCYKAGKLDEAERLARAALAACRRTDTSTSRGDTMMALAWLARILLAQEKYVEAEVAAREAKTILEVDLPDQHWSRFVVMSLLGGALLGQKRFSEAEPLLLQGYEGLSEWEPILGAPWNWRPTEAAERVVRFYDATNQPDKARTWREKLARSPRAAQAH